MTLTQTLTTALILSLIVLSGCELQPDGIIKDCIKETNNTLDLSISQVSYNCRLEKCIMIHSMGYTFKDSAETNYWRCLALNLEAEKIKTKVCP